MISLKILLYCGLVFNGASGFLKYKNEGCYLDKRKDVQLIGIRKVAERTLTQQNCNSFCFRNGYKYAATYNGTLCQCADLSEIEGNRIPPPDSAKHCNIPCANDIMSKCGGHQAYSIYSTGINESDITLRDLERLKIGCLEDSGQNRLLFHHKIDFYRTNTPKRCVAYCKALGYPHAGVQYKFECHCGLARRTSPLVDGCDKPCSGNPHLDCGGNWRLMVYSTEVYGMPTEVEVDNCYKYAENVETWIMKTTMNDITPNKCIAYCFDQGLPFAHIYNGDECLCGKTTPHIESQAAIDSCDLLCRGDTNEICGGRNYMITYKTGSHGDPSCGKLLGCFIDRRGDLLKGPNLNLGNENSISYCIFRCIQEGYAYAGLENGVECHCSNRKQSKRRLRMAGDDHCNIPCPKQELQTCGGKEFIAIYRTGVAPLEVSGGRTQGHRNI